MYEAGHKEVESKHRINLNMVAGMQGVCMSESLIRVCACLSVYLGGYNVFWVFPDFGSMCLFTSSQLL
jgi:hypothetical protein